MKILDNAEKPEGILVKVIEEDEKDPNSKIAMEEETPMKKEDKEEQK